MSQSRRARTSAPLPACKISLSAAGDLRPFHTVLYCPPAPTTATRPPHHPTPPPCRHLPQLRRKQEAEGSARGAEARLREIGAELETARTTLEAATAQYQQLSALCTRIRSG